MADTETPNLAELEKEYQRLKDLRSGGRYVPPAKLRALEERLKLKQGPEDQQRRDWESLKKAINSLINKVNHGNIKTIVQEIFTHNLIRGRGLYCRSVMKAQALALPFTPVYAALTAIINSKLPIVGELLLTRLILQFRKAFRRNNKALCLSSVMFIAHLCNHQVAHEIVALQILHLLLEKPTDDSVELAVAFVKEAGAYLIETSKTAMAGVFDRFREVLHQGQIEKRTQYMVEVLFQIRKDEFKDNPAVPAELDLVEEDDQITHMIGLDDELKARDTLNVFKLDQNYEANEEKYANIKREILGDDDDEEDDEEESESEEEKEEEPPAGKPGIKDMTNAELLTLRKTIYLTIMSSMSVDEATHKLLKIKIPEGQEIELVNMIVEACSQEKIYNKTYGSVAARLCYSGRVWRDLFGESFAHYYEIIHRYDTNQIRNIATLFGYILAADALGWEVFEVVHMNESESTSSSRIFIKIVFEEMKMELGSKKLAERFREEYMQPFLVNMFPKGKNAEDVRFSINYFTAIGLGVLTEDMREYLKNMPPPEEEDEEEGKRTPSYGDGYDDGRDSPSPRGERSASPGSPSPNPHRKGERRDSLDSVSPSPRPSRRREFSGRSPSSSPRRRTSRGDSPSPSPERSRSRRRDSPKRNRRDSIDREDQYGRSYSRRSASHHYRSSRRDDSVSASPSSVDSRRSSRSVTPPRHSRRSATAASASTSTSGHSRKRSLSPDEDYRRDRHRRRSGASSGRRQDESDEEDDSRRYRNSGGSYSRRGGRRDSEDEGSDYETDNRYHRPSREYPSGRGSSHERRTSRGDPARGGEREEGNGRLAAEKVERQPKREEEGSRSQQQARREYSPPPKRPRTWAEVEHRVSDGEDDGRGGDLPRAKPPQTRAGRKRASAADYL